MFAAIPLNCQGQVRLVVEGDWGLQGYSALPAEITAALDSYRDQRTRAAAEADRGLAVHRGELISRLEQLKSRYAGRPYVAQRIAAEIRKLQIEAGEPGDDSVSVMSLREPANLGKSFTFRVTGTTTGHVWGSDIYTDDSAVGAAAVHAGLLAAGETGEVRVTLLPGRESYQGVSRNGVTSTSYESWPGSYVIDRVTEATRVVEATITATYPAAPETMSGVAGEVGQSFVYQVTGSTEGSVWGSEIYTDDSSLAAAAVHAGLLASGQRGAIRVTILPGRTSYGAATRSGVSSGSWGAWTRSYMLDRPEAEAAPREHLRLYYRALE
jgi:hypothetical protein